jgi:hypothetical protein
MAEVKPRFHSTTVDAGKTAMQIGQTLQKYGAASFTVMFEDSEPSGIAFSMDVPGVGVVPVQVRARVDELAERLRRKVRNRRSEPDHTHARRVAWRQLQMLIEMQLELVQNGVRQFHEMFMADILGEDGRTVGDLFLESQGLLPGGTQVLRIAASERE